VIRKVFFFPSQSAPRSLSVVVERRKKEFLKIFDDDHNENDDEKTDPRKNGYVAYRPSGRTHEEREKEKHAPRDEASSRSSFVPSDIFSRACASLARGFERRDKKKRPISPLSFKLKERKRKKKQKIVLDVSSLPLSANSRPRCRNSPRSSLLLARWCRYRRPRTRCRRPTRTRFLPLCSFFFLFFEQREREGKSEGKSQLSLFFFHLFWSKSTSSRRPPEEERRERLERERKSERRELFQGLMMRPVVCVKIQKRHATVSFLPFPLRVR